MKKSIILVCFTIISIYTSAAYYVAGNGTSGNPWCDGKNWNPAGTLMTDSAGIHIAAFANVPAGYYQFKITVGNWNTNYGYARFSQDCSNIEGNSDGDGNICFTTTETQNLRITFDGTNICLTGDGNNVIDTTNIGVTGVPAESEDVMLQAFYWDSYSRTKYGLTKWANLLADTTTIRNLFTLVWFPPSAQADGVGYYPKKWSNQTSTWGSAANLKLLIQALHRGGSKAVADIVVNHRGNKSNWCDFYNEDFGTFGSYQLTSEHICSGDEAFTQSGSTCYGSTLRGNSDTGTNDGGCRDLDHTSEYVQEAITAYLQWMQTEMGFDGFRYDMVKGYSGRFVSQYNVATDPYFSVGEYWDGIDAVMSYLKSTKYNTMVFDFPLKYVLRDQLGKGYYTGLRNPSNSLRGRNLQKYAVTFIDNHDTFERSDSKDNQFIAYNCDIYETANRSKVLQANAYILSMPGIPCVFWPHFKAFESEISQMIYARKAAGIHSESVVSDETAGTNFYSATITGHRGQLIVRLGSARDLTAPVGFHQVVNGDGYTLFLSDNITATEQLPSEIGTRKRMIDGHIFIERDGQLYDAMGRRVK